MQVVVVLTRMRREEDALANFVDRGRSGGLSFARLRTQLLGQVRL
jgi:hypothetical protein